MTTFAITNSDQVLPAVNYLLSNLPTITAIGNISITGNVLVANATSNTITVSGSATIPTTFTQPFVSVRYATAPDGSTGFSTSPTNATYFGVYADATGTGSNNPARYQWTQATGGFGTTKFLYYSSIGGYQIVFQVATTAPLYYQRVQDSTAINLNIITSAGSITGNQIVPGTVTTSLIANLAITTPLIANSAVTASQIAANSINTGAIVANAITQAQIAYNAIGAAQILPNAITTSAIIANAVTAVQIASAAVGSIQIANGAVTQNAILANTISGNIIIASTLSGNTILANTLSGNTILANTFSGNLIIANTITSNQISTAYVYAGNILGNQIVANTLSGNQIVANTITSAQIVSNYVYAGTIQGNQIAANTITANQISTAYVYTGNLTANQISATGYIYAGNILGNQIAANYVYTGTLTAAQISATGYISATSITASQISATGYVYAGNISAGQITSPLNGTSQITDGTITGSKLQGTTITGDKIATGTITATNLAAGSITTDKISAGYVYGGTIQGTQIAAGTITANKINGTNLNITNGVIKSGTNPAISGSTMTGDGLIVNANGTFAFGNPTNNINYNGTNINLNGNSNIKISGTAVFNGISGNAPASLGSGAIIANDLGNTNSGIVGYALGNNIFTQGYGVIGYGKNSYSGGVYGYSQGILPGVQGVNYNGGGAGVSAAYAGIDQPGWAFTASGDSLFSGNITLSTGYFNFLGTTIQTPPNNSQYYLRGDGVWAPFASGGVSSISGTTSQINTSASTGAVTLSLPAILVTSDSTSASGIGIGGGDMVYVSSGYFRPGSDGSTNLGASTFRWNNVYFVGAINPSDVKLKQDIEDINTVEQRIALKLAGKIQKYRFIADVKRGNRDVRIGVIAQNIQQAFAEEGLDAFDYNILHENTWYTVDGSSVDAEQNMYTETAPGAVKVTELAVNYTDLTLFIISAMATKLLGQQ